MPMVFIVLYDQINDNKTSIYFKQKSDFYLIPA